MPGSHGDTITPPLTASIDAAVALVERVLPGGRRANGKRWDGICFASVGASRDVQSAMDAVKEAPTEPLALLQALFAALDAKAALAKPEPGAVG